MTNSVLYIDESKSNGYIIAAVAIPVGKQTILRKELQKLRFKGSKRVHFTNESDPHRKKIISRLLELQIQAIVYTVNGLREHESRELCIRNVLDYAIGNSVTKVVFELDESILKTDVVTVRSHLHFKGKSQEIEYSHSLPVSEPLLWIADAIAWCQNRGGDWKRRIAPLIIQEEEIVP